MELTAFKIIVAVVLLLLNAFFSANIRFHNRQVFSPGKAATVTYLISMPVPIYVTIFLGLNMIGLMVGNLVVEIFEYFRHLKDIRRARIFGVDWKEVLKDIEGFLHS